MNLVESLDSYLESLVAAGSLWLFLVAAVLLGLRHSFDPDHLAAVAAITSSGQTSRRAGAKIGLIWGAGHGLSVMALGAPLIVFGGRISSSASEYLERLVGLLIIILALRMIFRLFARQGPLASLADVASSGKSTAIIAMPFSTGLIHGLAGTSTLVLLLLATVNSKAFAVAGLTVFISAAPLSMAVASSLWVSLLKAIQGRVTGAGMRYVRGSIAFGALIFGVHYASIF